MKSIATLIVAATAALSASAYAADNIEPNNVPFQGVYGQQDPNGKTREQVRAELAEAKAQGLVVYGENEQPPAYAQVGSTLTRAQVQADLAHARTSGLEAQFPNGA